MSERLAHWYRCRICYTVMWSESKARYGDPYRCIGCRSYMRFQYSAPLPPADAGKGMVWNPGLADARAEDTEEQKAERAAWIRRIKGW